MTYDEIVAQFAAQGKFNPFQYNTETMARDLGFNGTARTQTGWGGSPSESTGQGTEAIYDLTPDFEQFLKGYSYEPATSGGRNAALDIRNSSGQMVQDDYRVGDHKGSMMKFMGAAIPALVAGGFGAGALGAMGVGPMAGGAAPASASGSFNAALGNSLADMSVMNTGATGAQAGGSAGLFGAGSEAAAGYIVPSAGQFAGMSIPQLNAASAALGGGIASGIPWGKIGAAAAAPAVSAGAQIYGANQAAGAMTDATDKANQLNAPAVAARNSALEQMQALLKDPSSLTSTPGYQFGMDQGTKSLNSGAAARGQTYSGGQAKALTRYGQDYAGTKLDQSFNRLSQLASGGQSGTTQTVDNITSAGNANAMPWIVGSNAVADGINGLTAYGQRKNWWGG